MHAVSSATMAFGCADERILSTLGAIRCHVCDVCGISLPTLCRPVSAIPGLDQLRQLRLLPP